MNSALTKRFLDGPSKPERKSSKRLLFRLNFLTGRLLFLQALVEAGLTFVDETQTFFYISSDKGLCSVSLQGRAPQSFLPSTDSTPPAKPDSLDGPRIHHVAVPDGSGDQMWACLPALCGFSAGASGGNSPLAAPDFAPLETGWDTVFDVDGGDQLVLTVSGLGLTRLFYASRPSTVPPAPLKPLWSLGPVGFGDPPRDRRWFGVLAPPDPFATKASQAATNIKFPAALLMEAGDAGAVSTTTLTVIEDCNSFKALEGPTDAASLPVVPMGFIEGTAVCAPVLHVSNQGRREVVVQWQQSEGPIDLQNLVVQEMHIWSPAPGSNLAASSPWNAAVGAKSLEQLLSEGPPDLLPAMNFKYKSALSCYALHLPSKPA